MPSPINIIVALVLLARGGYDFRCPCAGNDDPATTAITAPRIGAPLPATTKITRSTVFSGLKPSNKHYTVDCKLKTIATYKDRSDATIRSQPLEIPFPKLAVADGEMVTIQDTATKSFAVASTNKGIVPITREVWEGTKCEICVIGADDGKAVVDINLTMQSANDGGGQANSIASPDSHAIRVHTATGRMIDSVKLGETTKATFESFKLEVVVKEANE